MSSALVSTHLMQRRVQRSAEEAEAQQPGTGFLVIRHGVEALQDALPRPVGSVGGRPGQGR